MDLELGDDAHVQNARNSWNTRQNSGILIFEF